MKYVCVIIGGSTGIGLATAEIFAENNKVIIADENSEKLENASKLLSVRGAQVITCECDVSSRESVSELAEIATTVGLIATVVNCAGVSSYMPNYQQILNINTNGCKNVCDVFENVIEPEGVLINLTLPTSYLLPRILIPNRLFKLCLVDGEPFQQRLESRLKLFPRNTRKQIAYCISRQFVHWYTHAKSRDYSQKGLRILSVSPGIIDTTMEELKDAGGKEYHQKSEMDISTEISQLIYFLADPRLSYLTAINIICAEGLMGNNINFRSRSW